MKQIVFTLLLMAAAFQGYSKNSSPELNPFILTESKFVDEPFAPTFEDCRITLRASVGFITVEISVSASTCGGAYREAFAALRDAVDSARQAIK